MTLLFAIGTQRRGILLIPVIHTIPRIMSVLTASIAHNLCQFIRIPLIRETNIFWWNIPTRFIPSGLGKRTSLIGWSQIHILDVLIIIWWSLIRILRKASVSGIPHIAWSIPVSV